ncbi:hypothetical protein GCM10022207_81660 [Streptomyces lannensis]|uniref:Transposase n=1 Tax=Streptomyces lannensis TaxID=766498 RepID=A0ABP7LJI0_9ACTN
MQRSVFASCGQEAFFEGHVHALRTLGGVPRSKVRYDNLKAAVARVLGLSRAMALRAGALTADAVALEARKIAQAEDEPAGNPSPAGAAEATVTFLHEWRLAHLPPDTRPLPSVTHYDQLLRRRRASGGEHREGEAQ